MAVFTKDNLNVFHIHVPRTGGTSIEIWFERSGYSSTWIGNRTRNRKCALQHYDAELIEKFIRPNVKWDYSFITVRHPLTKMLSECKLRRVKDVNKWINHALDKMAKNPYVWDNHLRPQHQFLVNGIDRVFKFEEINSRQKILKDKFPDLVGDMPHFSKGRRKILPNAISKESIARIQEVYKKDYETFGYNL